MWSEDDMEWKEQGYSNDILLKFLVGIYQQVKSTTLPYD